MSAALLASLEAAIDKWTEQQVESTAWVLAMDETWFSEQMVPRMAQAAYIVFMAHIESQKAARDNT